MAEGRPTETVFQLLAKATQRLARIFGERTSGSGHPAPTSHTEAAALKERIEAAEEALAVDTGKMTCIKCGRQS